MNLIKHIKALSGEAEWPMWKRKILDLLDYHEGALAAIDGKLVKPSALAAGSDDKMVKNHKLQSDLCRKANSYAKPMITSAVEDAVCQKIMDKETPYEMWEVQSKISKHRPRISYLRYVSTFFHLVGLKEKMS
ncbi:hypothetical protein GWI33_023098 [Rhynchophorus ferrugineus]|uniref:Uncharacterized protein n=1 Tax=Rhynchophorus ferrugineus TaxID=354439 RepID=A0A834IPC5_RHYFE|nr:hypothetical protein GWI33_023098 [Rhynchophorus ferrugineus]